MKGVVFTEFLEMVERDHGIEMTDQLLDLPNLTDGGAYSSVGTYDHKELVEMMVELSKVTEVPLGELLCAYGEHLFSRFVLLFPEVFEGQEDALRFLAGVHDRIHVQVHKLYPEAELPRFECVFTGDGLEMKYESPRPFAQFAEGLINGCLAHFGDPRVVEAILPDGGDGTRARFKIQ